MFTVLGSVVFVPAVLANTNEELRHIQEERREVQSQLSEAEQQVADLMTEIDQINAQLARLDEAMRDNEKKIEETTDEIDSVQEETDALQVEIEVKQADIDARMELLGQRAASYQKSGGNISYLEVLLGASSFGDFIDRVLAIAKIARADTEFINQLEQSQQELVEKQAELEEKLTQLQEMMTELEGMQHHILDQKEQNDELLETLKSKENEVNALIEDLTQHATDLRNAEEDIKRRIEAERRRQEEESSSASPASTSSSVTQSSNRNTQTASSQTTATTNGTVSDLIQAGFKYFGNSVYVFGGGRTQYDIDNGRFDCSGFTRWAFSQIGISIGASTDSQIHAGRQVPASERRPGDLVFFDTYKRDGHVAIYMGGGQFIGAQSSTGVAIASMSSGYWAQRFNGRVVRVID